MGKEATAMADEVQQLKDDVSSNGSGSRLSGLTNKSVLFPVAAAAASAAAAGLASKKGPDLMKNDRIAWKSVSGTQHSGVISFHKLDANLTRVLVTVDFVPTGMIEKMASGMRFAKRAVQADLARFKAYVEMGDAKGLEYKSTPDEMEQHRDDDDGGDDQEAQSRSGEDDSRDDGARDSDREERASRREERRKSLASS